MGVFLLLQTQSIEIFFYFNFFSFLQYDILNRKKNQSSTAATSPLLQLALSARVQINPVEIKKCNSDLVLHLWTKYRDVFGRLTSDTFFLHFMQHQKKWTFLFELLKFIFSWHTIVGPPTPWVWSQNVQWRHIWQKKACKPGMSEFCNISPAAQEIASITVNLVILK